MKSIFRAYDIRGIVEKELTFEIAEKIGKAFGTLVSENEVVVGYDTRSTSPKLFEYFTNGVLSTGKDVISLGMVPNPIAYFNGFFHKLPGVIITASHNPPEYNGFKFFRANGTSFTDELIEIRKIIEENKFSTGAGDFSEIDFAIEDYKEYLMKRINIDSKVKFVAECFNASASIVTPYLFQKFGLDCIPLNNDIKGDFGGKRPEPKSDNIKQLTEVVVDKKAEFGVAFDGDADRSVFVDEKGNYINPSKIGALFIKDALSSRSGKIVATIDCPSSIKKIVEENGGILIWSRIGHGFIEENLVKENALFAYEQSSHFYFNSFYPFSDGFLATLKLAEILSKSQKSLSQMIKEIKINPTSKIYVNAKTHEIKKEVVDRVKERFDGEDCVDGIKIHLNDEEWVLIRESQTNPEINICAEAKDEKRLNELVEKYKSIVNEEIKKVSK